MSSSAQHMDAIGPLSIVVVGASGDLARRKIIPALFALYSQNFLPASFHVFGFARSPMSNEEFRQKVTENLTCRYVPQSSCADRMNEFLARCEYVSGQYDSADSFLDLFEALKKREGGRPTNRLYYMAIPPSVFVDVARSLGRAGLVACGPTEHWSRVVIEKPFGRDRESSDVMARELAAVFGEKQIYRIDHYLGKEIIQDLLALRFANTIFQPLWNRECIESVHITWKEDFGIGDRGGYFDPFGIIRDVMQNHLVQILSLLAMEEPDSLDSHDVRNGKVAVLRSIPPLAMDDVVIGQYRGRTAGPARARAYTEEHGVPADSVTPTFAAAALRVNNPRWKDVPFFLQAGKALDARRTEVRIRFRPQTRNLFASVLPQLPSNELVIRVQPDEAIFFRILNKVPGLRLSLVESELNLKYESAFRELIPDAYECLLLDALQGDKSLFIRNDELAAAWDIFTPVLHELERVRLQPEPYEFGSRGPAAADALMARKGAR